ncbi:hypothetical protein [Prochlorothrix hollandica]|uniref:hypothetical protein n=1 Tax=Prochlorothrix hollandica TaxID=1223 RepID=UPI00334251B4
MTLLQASFITVGLTSLLVVGCFNSSTPEVESSQVQEIQETPAPPSAELIFEQALSAAYNASTLTQGAQSINDWEAVSQGWQSAIEQLSSIPESSEKYEQAQQKIGEYQSNLNYAKQELADAQELAKSEPTPQSEASEVLNSPVPIPPRLIGRSSGGEWFVGGNLHDKTMKEWNQGTADNKLATAGDMASTLFPNLPTADLVKPYAEDLVKCLDETGKKILSADEQEKEVEKFFDDSAVAEIASFCAVLMGW